jgi:molecular chaperone HscB
MLDFSKNYFELFGLPLAYQVDRDQLAERYRELQQETHPDRYAHASEQEKRLSMQAATHLNEALETLKDPILRGRYLLSLNGVEMDVTQSTQDTAFLMEQLERREELAEAKSQSDPYAVTDRIQSDVKKRLEGLAEELATLFENPDGEKMAGAQEILRKMQFLQKLRHDAQLLEEELDEAI